MASGSEDEWFVQAEREHSEAEERSSGEEWLIDTQPPAASVSPLWALATRQVLVPAAVVVTFLISLLAAAGAFEGAGRPSGPPLLTTTEQASVTAAPPEQTTTSAVVRPTFVAPTTTLKPGDSGAQVKDLQQELQSLGYSVGTIDGSYGPGTSQAVAAFQRAHGLVPDGIVGPRTLTALAP